MSFTEDIKNEVSQIVDETHEEKMAMLAAIVKINGTLGITNKGLEIRIKTENKNTAKFIYTMFQEVFHIVPKISYSINPKFKKNEVYMVSTTNNPRKILQDLEIMEENGQMNATPSKQLIATLDILKCYLRGAFLASGSINNPQSGYHLEISTNDEELSKYMAHLLNRYKLGAKTAKRRNKYITYLKKSENIADFLKLIKSNEGLMFFEDYRIQKDFVNSSNRALNCDIANSKKIADLFKKHKKIIEDIHKYYLYNSLTERQKKIIEIRLEHEEFALAAIAEAYNEETGESISKSTVYNEFEKMNKEVTKMEHLING